MRCVILVHLVHRRLLGKILSSLEGNSRRDEKVRHDCSRLSIDL